MPEIKGSGLRVKLSSFSDCVEFYVENCLAVELSNFAPDSIERKVFDRILSEFTLYENAYEVASEVLRIENSDFGGYGRLLATVFSTRNKERHGLEIVEPPSFESTFKQQLDSVLLDDNFNSSTKKDLVKLIGSRIISPLVSGKFTYTINAADRSVVDDVLEKLSNQEGKMIRLHYGLDEGDVQLPYTAIAEVLGNVSRSRIGQIHAKALRKLCHPSRSRKLHRLLQPLRDRIDHATVILKENNSLRVNEQKTRQSVENHPVFIALRAEVHRLTQENDKLNRILGRGVDLSEPEVEFYALGVDELEISIRTYNGLRNAGIRTVRELCDTTASELMVVKNFGKKSLTEIMDLLKEKRLSLREE